MEQLIISMMNEFGYFGIFLLIAIENIFPPIPSELILAFGGFMTAHSKLNISLVILFATLVIVKNKCIKVVSCVRYRKKYAPRYRVVNNNRLI